MVDLDHLTHKERQTRGLDLVGQALRPIIDDRMGRAAHGEPWVPQYEAAETRRRGHMYRVSLDDPRALLRILRFERRVFTEIDASQRAWIDELIQASNRVAHSTDVTVAHADRALDTMVLLAESLAFTELEEELTQLRVARTAPEPGATHNNATAPTTRTAPDDTREAEPGTSDDVAPEVAVAERVLMHDIGPGLRTLSARIDSVEIVVVYREAVNYALAHNSIPAVVSATVRHEGVEVVQDLRLTVSLDSPDPNRALAAPLSITLGDIPPGAVVAVPTTQLAWRLSPAPFLAFDEAVSTDIHLDVQFAESIQVRDTDTIRLLTADEWWAQSIPELIGAFIRPNDDAIGTVLAQASELLRKRTGSPSLDGYQAGPERVHQIAEAIYDALVALRIRYVEPPASFEATGQRIRSHRSVVDERHGTCLDLATLYAAALEQAGLHPVLVITRNHAFAGFLTEDSQLPNVTVDSPGAIATIVDSDIFEAVETTALCDRETPLSFDQARGAAHPWWKRDLDQVRYLLDVRAAHRIVRPLPNIRVEDGSRIVEVVTESPATPSRSIPSTRGETQQHSDEPGRVTRWRRALLDMSYANPLLKLKKASSVPVHVPDDTLARLEDAVADGRQLRLQPHDDLAEIHRARGARTASDVDSVSLRRLVLEEDRLFVALSQHEYHRRIRNLARKARTATEETGTSSLYLALGTMEWKERAKDGRAPLFLVPIRLVGGRGTRPFELVIDETRSVEPNYCLVEKLRVTWGLTIPELTDPGEDQSGIDVSGALAAARSAILRANIKDIHVEETGHLTLLHFSTLEMWRDLSENWRTFMKRPTVRHLVETPGMPYVDDIEPPGDSATAEATTYLPIPADGSQIEAVRWAAAGKSFILEGPPGTGKSQTITNLIAHLLAEGKKVLFVAEKQAALDVVKRRLDGVGLSTFSLDVHGRNQTITSVREQISEALDTSASSDPAWESTRSTYRSLVENLAQYPQQLHEPGPAEMSAWDARQVVLEIRESTSNVRAIDVPRAVVLDPDRVRNVRDAGRELGGALGRLGAPPAMSPWRLAGPAEPELLDRHEALRRLEVLRAADAAVPAGSVHHLCDLATRPDEFDSIVTWLRTAVYGAPRTPRAARATATAQWRAHAENARQAVAALWENTATSLPPFAPGAIWIDVEGFIARSAEIDKQLFGKKKSRRALLAELGPYLAVAPESVPIKELTATLQRLLWVRHETVRCIEFVRQLPEVPLPHQWNPLEGQQAGALDRSIGGVLAAAALDESMFRGQDSHTREVFDAATDEILATCSQLPQNAPETVAALSEAWFGLLGVLKTTPDDLAFWLGPRTRGEALAQDLPTWTADASGASFVRLGRWLAVRTGLERLASLGMTSADALVRSGTTSPGDVEDAIQLGVAEEVLAERLDTTGLIAFDPAERSRLTERFITTGEDIRERMVHELPARIVAARTFDPRQRVGTVAELRQQLSRRRGGLTIRQLLHRFGSLITQVTPCFLMSPASVSRFLPAEGLEFDVVVFDEASQIRVPDAIGAMGRGRSVVVVGDSKQMPPTSMFGGTGSSDDNDADGEGDAEGLPVPNDLESILTESVESNLQRLLLTWHYRSRDESLIAFSNQTYYEGRLSTFPAPPDAATAATALELRRVDGTWEGGGRSAARVNRSEADAIVEEVRRLAPETPERSVGIVTFNSQQRDLILDKLDDVRETDTAVDEALSRDEEPLFVKNLENVQGDERDVILFTLAFARDKSGRVPLNWGPLSRTGGEKRLNVAITRAKERVVVFASFDPHDLDLSTSRSLGLAHLKDYLLVAKHGAERAATPRHSMRDRHLEEIAAALRAEGLEVLTMVGLSDFTVDIAVRAPERPWVAVLLDNRSWADRTSVGDRDGLPRLVLTGSMRWSRVERVWLPAWIRDPHDVVRQIVSVANTAEAPAPGETAPVREISRSRPHEHELVASNLAMTPPSAPVTHEDIALSARAEAPLPDGVSLFTAADDSPVRSSADLEGTGQRVAAMVRREMGAIVKVESPMLLDRLLKLTAARFGISRLRTSRREQLLRFLSPAAIDEAANGDRVVWSTPDGAQRHTGYRVAGPEGDRDINDVPYPELRNAMVSLVRRSHGMDEEDALRETAREFGVLRLASKVRPRLEGVLSAAIHEGLLTRRGGRIEV